MDHQFDILITHNSEELIFKGEFVPTGYTYKILVELNDKVISFEPDEERKFRAIAGLEEIGSFTAHEKIMIELIMTELTTLFKA